MKARRLGEYELFWGRIGVTVGGCVCQNRFFRIVDIKNDLEPFGGSMLRAVAMIMTVLMGSSAWGAEEGSSYSWQRVGDAFVSPVTTEARPVVLWGTGLVGVLLATSEQTIDPLQESLSERKPLGASAEFGDLMGQMVPNALYALGFWGYGKWAMDSSAIDRAIYMLEVSAYSGIFTSVAKTIAHQRRPNGGDYRSFPSGHTTTAFAFASVVGVEHPWYYAVPAYALATFVGISRINDNKHYLHDVVAGATVGISYGLGIHYLNQKSATAGYRRPSSSWQLVGLGFDAGKLSVAISY